MKNFFKNFSANEAGAVTVDWVVLAAAVVGLSAVVGTTVKTAISTKANAISTSIAAAN
ncbi:Flp family type IVb pilin [Paragemmobacter straminiformis]|uniref:Flp family type IVb pilin n=1 Tax=Paragemmobacter straminiformis TaxID=2045119 RepID=UPI003BB1A62A